MDTFVAIVRVHAHPEKLKEMEPAAEQAVRGCCGESSQSFTFADSYVVVACAPAKRATDSVLETLPDGSLTYVHGQLAYLGSARDVEVSSDKSRQPVDRRLYEYRAAVRASFGGYQGLECLSGSFHGLAHDPKRTLVATDRLGSRPLFVCRAEGLLCLASDIRCLLALPDVDTSLDVEGLVQLVRIQAILEDRTLYRAIKVLPPATLLGIDHENHTIFTRQYWTWTGLPVYQTEEEAVEATARAFSDATRRIVAGHEKTVILLSGGMDSRIIVACLQDQVQKDRIEAYTFGPKESDEMLLAKRVADTVGLKWTQIVLDTDIYWTRLPDIVAAGNGLHSFAHAHTFQTASALATSGFGTALNGWGLDLLLGGSYLPREQFRVLGRDLYGWRLAPLGSTQDVVEYLHRLLDILQFGDFGQSMLNGSLRPVWQDASRQALQRIVAQSQSRTEVPYDWVDQALFGFGIAKFRSYPMVTGVRAQLRERNPLFESDVLDTYRRLPYRWRFFGRVYRRALLQLNPQLAQLQYVNTKTSPLASAIRQAVVPQAHALWRANVARVRGAAAQLGISLPAAQPHGSYPDGAVLASYLAGDEELPARIRQLMVDGPLSKAGLVDGKAVRRAIEDCGRGRCDPSNTLLVLATLAYWLDDYPARIG